MLEKGIETFSQSLFRKAIHIIQSVTEYLFNEPKTGDYRNPKIQQQDLELLPLLLLEGLDEHFRGPDIKKSASRDAYNDGLDQLIRSGKDVSEEDAEGVDEGLQEQEYFDLVGGVVGLPEFEAEGHALGPLVDGDGQAEPQAGPHMALDSNAQPLKEGVQGNAHLQDRGRDHPALAAQQVLLDVLGLVQGLVRVRVRVRGVDECVQGVDQRKDQQHDQEGEGVLVLDLEVLVDVLVQGLVGLGQDVHQGDRHEQPRPEGHEEPHVAGSPARHQAEVDDLRVEEDGDPPLDADQQLTH
jgi:hypothetical protein